jgi:spore maturation protein CgeB
MLHRWDLKRLNRRLIEMATIVRPHVCLSVGGFYNLPGTITTLRNMGIPMVLWTTDVPTKPFSHIIHTAHLYDQVFCAGTEAMDLLTLHQVRNIHWLPFACDPFYHRPLTLTDDEKHTLARDVVFVGSYYPNRWKLLQQLAHLNIGIWGPGWDRVINDRNRNIVKNIHLNHTEWIKIYNASKIVIIIHYQDGHTPCHQASPKIFESLACKCFVLVDDQKDVFRMFRSGQHLVAFHNIEDLKDKIQYFLIHEEERKSIAENGYKEVTQKHTYQHRIREILEHIENIDEKNEAILS